MNRGERRAQLLDVAQLIIQEEGTDGLTLGYLAERAGVSKPIAYDHFGSRAGLLIALYKAFDDTQAAALADALERTQRQLPEVARVVADAYMRCCAKAGPEWHAVSAALKGEEETEAYYRDVIDGYVDFYCKAFAPYSKLERQQLRLRCVGIIGAGEALSQDMLSGRVDEAAAAACLASLIVAWLSECDA
ncbi:TetR/AcrR family transcriptional regulator [Alkalilimnicola ehrlichii]|nr:TetR/AcrR family transcriptional regulator [Alkalilimnicola ehrlichii]